jgi:hypothetical protein
LPLLALGCGGSEIPPTGPCSVEQRAEIGAVYLARLRAACPTATSLEECEAAHPEIRADYDRQRLEFIKCSTP